MECGNKDLRMSTYMLNIEVNNYEKFQAHSVCLTDHKIWK